MESQALRTFETLGLASSHGTGATSAPHNRQAPQVPHPRTRPIADNGGCAIVASDEVGILVTRLRVLIPSQTNSLTTLP
jgi:hypothetical protein